VTERPAGRVWLITLAAAIGVAATFALGLWQLGRAHQKLDLQAAMEGRMAAPPVDARALLSGTDPQALMHRAVVLRGTWVPGKTVFLDNRQMRGLPGFYVATPLQLEGTGRAVLVERGWVQRNFAQREQLPPVETPAGAVEIRGRIAPHPAKLYELGTAGQGPIRQNLDLGQFRAETGLPLLDIAVMQIGPPSEGLLRDWPQATSGVEKHFGYAFQWWALSVLIAILYVWFQFIAPRRRAPHA
jgi:surfeit locus 1 family protein